jgi:hypothetical protein
MAERAAQQEPEVRLDTLTLASKEGWQRFVNTAAWVRSAPLNHTQLEVLSEEAFDEYNRQSRGWHASLGAIKTAQLAALREDFPGLGKAGLRCEPSHWR